MTRSDLHIVLNREEEGELHRLQLWVNEMSLIAESLPPSHGSIYNVDFVSELKKWFSFKFPGKVFQSMQENTGPFRQLLIFYRNKTDEEVYREQMDYFIGNLKMDNSKNEIPAAPHCEL